MPSRFHVFQIKIAMAIFFVVLPLYIFGPHETRETLAGFLGGAVFFIFGKFTNGFPRPPSDDLKGSSE